MRSNPTLKALAVMALLGLLTLPLAAQPPAAAAAPAAAPAPSPNDASGASYLLNHPRALARFLGLTADQTTQLLGFWNTYTTAVNTLRQARPAMCTQLRTDLAASTQDPNAVGADALDLFNNKQQIRAARDTFDTSFSAILTPAELAKYQTLKQIAKYDNGPGVDILGDCPPPAPPTT